MQVVVFDKFFKCIYRLRDVPREWNFLDVTKALDLQHPPQEYQAIRLADFAELCIDEYVYKDGRLALTSTNCN